MRQHALPTLAALALGLAVTVTLAAQTAERPRLYGLAHVAFRVSDMAAAETFYGDWLRLGRDRRRVSRLPGRNPPTHGPRGRA